MTNGAVCHLQLYRLIPLSRGQWASVDTADYEQISRHKWCAAWDPTTRGFRAMRRVRGVGSIYMHREILGLAHGDPRKGDHKDPGRTLINQRYNLRLASHAENVRNQRKRIASRSGFKGVTLRPNGMFQARIRFDGKLFCLGDRSTAEAAHRELYVPAARRLHGEFARTE